METKEPFTEDERFAVAVALRDWIHKQPFSQCGVSADTCPDWPLAFEIRNVALDTLARVRKS